MHDCPCALRALAAAAVLSTVSWFFLFVASLRVISPVLRTLTVAYSDDTIYALTFILFAVSTHAHHHSPSSCRPACCL